MVPSVDRALRILELLTEADLPMGVNQIAKRLGISPSTCFNILKTLEMAGYLDFDERSKAYTLGPAAVQFATRALDLQRSFDKAHDIMSDLATRHGTAGCVLWRLRRDNRLMVVGHVMGRRDVSFQLDPGKTLPLLIGATGRCAAAFLGLSREEIASMLDGLNWDRAPSLKEYLRQVEQARERGWAVDCGDFIKGITTIATPVDDGREGFRFCLSVALFGDQNDPEHIAEVASELVTSAGQVAERLFVGAGKFESAAPA